MNPDRTDAEFQRSVFAEDLRRIAEAQRRAELHRRAVARRRKAKRGGPR